MVVGFNHNFRYRGEVYHVQTEDSGLRNPHIITLLYHGGTILASQKTSYADIAKIDNLERVVEDLMKEQHKEMLRRLKDGELDDLIDGSRPLPDSPAERPAPSATVPATAAVTPAAAVGARPPAAAPSRTPTATSAARVAVAPPPSSPAAAAEDQPEEQRPGMSLDDLILSYLVGDDQ
jgi:hypothetical protein